MISFGQYVREKRLALHIGLRNFCLRTGIRPGEWSDIERHDAHMTLIEKLQVIAETIHVPVTELEAVRVTSLEIPLRVLTDNEKLISVLPAFFPKTGNQEQDDHALREYVKQNYESAYSEPLSDNVLKVPNEKTLQAMGDAENRTNLTRINSIDELLND